MTVILDAMGSDTHPLPEVLAAIRFAREIKEEIILVGNEDIVETEDKREQRTGTTDPYCACRRSAGDGRQTGGKCPKESPKFDGSRHGIAQERRWSCVCQCRAIRAGQWSMPSSSWVE